MKKWIALLLVLVMVLGMAGCGKSEKAKAADDLIAAIGTVTLESEKAISDAEKAVSDLEEEDLKSLENAALLEKAREEYDALVKKAEEERQAKADAEKVSVVEAAIDAIGEVTLESRGDIDAAKNAYDALESRLQSEVSNYGKIAEAESALAGLEAAQHVEQVEQLIDRIGVVDKDSGEVILAAKEALNALTAEEQAMVTNHDALTEAIDTYSTIMREYADNLLKSFKLEEDVFQGVKFYYPPAWKLYSNGSWMADKTSFIRPYIGVSGNTVWIRVIYNYTGRDWVFWTKLTVLADSDRFTKSYSYLNIVRNNSGGKVWEYYDDNADIAMLRAIAGAESVQMRFEGSDYSADFTLDAADKEAIQQTLEIYDALIASGYK